MQPDQPTFDAYQSEARTFADDWDAQPAPCDLQQLVQDYFIAGSAIDVGCGAGRDTRWLNLAGYPTTGVDASQALIELARERQPGIEFRTAELPDLSELGNSTFDNVFCETVIMHLPPQLIGPAVKRLLSLLQPRGVLYVSWRVTQTASQRDGHGRLYSAFDTSLVRDLLSGATLMLDEQLVSASSGKIVHRIVARLDA